MKKIHATQFINAAPEKVWHVMLDKPTYELWTKAFSPDGSVGTYEGSWEQDAKIRFVGTDADGKQSGMMSRVKENRPFQFMSLEHYGMIMEGVEDTTSDMVKQFVPAIENYTFTAKDGGTEVTVDQDAADMMFDEFSAAWPKALLTLKELAERP